MENQRAVNIENVSKQYRLGVIGGATLKGDIQSWWARKRGKQDPNVRIGSEQPGRKGDKFWALKDVSLDVFKGEALGIIGRNGAGKSTLLKLISQITLPTEGTIRIKGRVSSMLEVGTGFHGELTGRENVYMNGAILGMSRAEITSKMNEIVEFSEVGAFIDTPVKRYSSGMYVKLAFSVAAHLESEIMIMDEVLAVGDVNFQNKCIKKMKSIAGEDGRTVIYVSHNMATVRNLCDRVAVLNGGRLVYQGEVEEGIKKYIGENVSTGFEKETDLSERNRPKYRGVNGKAKMTKVRLEGGENNVFDYGSKIVFTLEWTADSALKKVNFRFNAVNADGAVIGVSFSEKPLKNSGGVNVAVLELDTVNLVPSRYSAEFCLCNEDERGMPEIYDVVSGFDFMLIRGEKDAFGRLWTKSFGNVLLPGLKVKKGD